MYKNSTRNFHLTIIRRRRGDYPTSYPGPLRGSQALVRTRASEPRKGPGYEVGDYRGLV